MNWGPVIAGLLCVISALLSVLVWQFNRVTEKVDDKVDKSDCEKDRQNCSRGPDWNVFNHHGHTGLPVNSKVVQQ